VPYSSFDSNKDLQRALANLEAFSQQLEKEPFPNLSHLDVREGQIVPKDEALSKVMSLAYNIVGYEATSAEESKKVLAEVEESVQVVDRYFHLLQSMENQGNSEQQKFAAYAMQEIARFNKIIDQTSESPPTLTGRIVHFIYRKSGLLIGKKLKKIQIPQLPVRKLDFPQMPQKAADSLKISTTMNSETAAASSRIASLHETVMPGWQVSRQTLELYAMKVIALLVSKHALNHQEARVIFEKTAKEMHVNRQEKLLTISQHLKPEPGKIVHIAISFKAHPLTSAFTIPKPPFQMTSKSEQTGFPHPLQHHGWALSDFLVPSVVYSPEDLPTLQELISKKAEIAQELLPTGKYVDIARELLRVKRKVFSSNYSLFGNLHKELMTAMAIASEQDLPLAKYKEIFSNFFETAASTVSPYDYIADANQLIIECITDRPKQSLEKYWLEESKGNLIDIKTFKKIFEEDLKKSLQELNSKKEKSESEKEKITLEYCIILSKLLFPYTQKILLQHYSKALNVISVELDDFAKKLQVSLYNQLEEFQNELKISLDPNEVEKRLEKLLRFDIQLFQAKDIQTLGGKAVAISKELEHYYKTHPEY